MKTTVGVLGLFAASACGGAAAPCDTSVPGQICTIIGSGQSGYEGDEAVVPLLEARMSLPQDTLTAPDGTVYVLDWNNHRIRKATQDGMLVWVAGRGELGRDLDDPAGDQFRHPTNMIFGPSGETLIVADWHSSKIVEVDIATGEVTDLAGTGGRNYFGDDGPALASTLNLPASLAWDPDGNLVVMDQANQVLRMIDQEGMIHLVAGQCIVETLEPCTDGEVPVACPDSENGTPSGKVTCGNLADSCRLPCSPGYLGGAIPATEMRMAQPFGASAVPAGRIVFDGAGNLYFADTNNHMIRMIDTGGIVHRIAGQPPVDDEPQRGYAGDGGPATEATLSSPVDLALADDGTLYFTDVLNHCVRAIDPDGTIRTVAGVCGTKGYAGDGGPATEALLYMPFGIEWVDGRLIISDTGNDVIRSVLVAE